MVRIRDLRLAHGLTLSDLAQRIREQGVDITESGISNVENARKRASDRLLTAWSKAPPKTKTPRRRRDTAGGGRGRQTD
jgi:transcriptional regulator with XRE-family HTH domain